MIAWRQLMTVNGEDGDVETTIVGLPPPFVESASVPALLMCGKTVFVDSILLLLLL